MRMAIIFSFLIVLVIPTKVWSQSVEVVDIKGNALVRQDKNSRWEKLQAKQTLPEGAEIKTNKNASLTITFDAQQKNVVTVEKNTSIKIEDTSPGSVFLSRGRVFTLIDDVQGDKKFEIKTPTAIAGARGTGWITEFTDGVTNVSCFDDVVYVASLDETGHVTGQLDVSEGFEIAFKDEVAPSALKEVSEESKQQWQGFMTTVDQVIEIPRRESSDQSGGSQGPNPGEMPKTGADTREGAVKDQTDNKLQENRDRHNVENLDRDGEMTGPGNFRGDRDRNFAEPEGRSDMQEKEGMDHFDKEKMMSDREDNFFDDFRDGETAGGHTNPEFKDYQERFDRFERTDDKQEFMNDQHKDFVEHHQDEHQQTYFPPPPPPPNSTSGP